MTNRSSVVLFVYFPPLPPVVFLPPVLLSPFLPPVLPLLPFHQKVKIQFTIMQRKYNHFCSHFSPSYCCYKINNSLTFLHFLLMTGTHYPKWIFTNPEFPFKHPQHVSLGLALWYYAIHIMWSVSELVSISYIYLLLFYKKKSKQEVLHTNLMFIALSK